MKDFERRMQPSHCIVHSPFQIREDLSTREYFTKKNANGETSGKFFERLQDITNNRIFLVVFCCLRQAFCTHPHEILPHDHCQGEGCVFSACSPNCPIQINVDIVNFLHPRSSLIIK